MIAAAFLLLTALVFVSSSTVERDMLFEKIFLPHCLKSYCIFSVVIQKRKIDFGNMDLFIYLFVFLYLFIYTLKDVHSPVFSSVLLICPTPMETRF